MKQLDWSEETGAAYLRDIYGKDGCKELRDDELIEFADFLGRQVAALQEVAS